MHNNPTPDWQWPKTPPTSDFHTNDNLEEDFDRTSEMIGVVLLMLLGFITLGLIAFAVTTTLL